MHPSTALVRFGVVMGMDFACAAVFHPILRLPRLPRVVCFAGLIVLVGASPGFIPIHAHLLRFFATLWVAGMFVKLYDVNALADEGIIPSAGTYLRYLPNGFWNVMRRRPREALWPPRKNVAALGRRGTTFVLACLPLWLVFRHDWSSTPFFAEHAAKAITTYAVLISGTNAVAAAWRLAGGVGLDFFGSPATAATPAEFWRQWNRPTAQWLHEYVFLPFGGVARPLRATAVTFVISAILHEYVFTAMLGRVQGLQVTFFVLQGVASVATLRLRPRGGHRIFGIACTFLFSLTTSVLFFVSLNHAFPFYSRPIPVWVGAWDRATSR